jgi:hypothetical protein
MSDSEAGDKTITIEASVVAQGESESRKPHCGIVMPISAIDGCPEQHWTDVKSILSDAIDSAGFTTSLVSAADDVGVIQKRIIQNLYENPIVVCDVSGKNPNVMFELGMRLAFDRPVVIVKDEATTYSFDTAPIEHLEYPRDLRYGRIVAFKAALAQKVIATHTQASENKSYTTFLKHFGQFSVATLETKEVSSSQYIIEQLRELRELVVTTRRTGSAARTRMSGLTSSLTEAISTQTRVAVRERMQEKGVITFPEDMSALVENAVSRLRLTATSAETLQQCRDFAEVLIDEWRRNGAWAEPPAA